MKLKVCSGITLFVWALLTSPAGLQAAIPPVMTVQGQMAGVDAAGVMGGTNMPAATQEMDLRIYTTNFPAALYGKSKVPVLLEQGRFVAEIGDAARLTNSTNSLSGTPYSSFIDMLADATNTAFYLGIHPTGLATNLFPLMRIQSVPFALVAGDVKQASSSSGFTVLNGTATLQTMSVQGTTTLEGPVTFAASSSNSVFMQQVTVGGDVNVTAGATCISAMSVSDSSESVNAALTNGVDVTGDATVQTLTVNGSATLSTNLTTVGNLIATNGLTVNGTLRTLTSNPGLVFHNVTATNLITFQLGASASLHAFGSRMCITNINPTSYDTSNFTNQFFEKLYSSYIYGCWKATDDCFVTASYVVGQDDTTTTEDSYIAMTGTTLYQDIPNLSSSSYCIAKPYARTKIGYSYGAQEGCVCLFMRKGTWLAWYSPNLNTSTVFGAGFMRDISVLYFAK